VRNRRNLYPFLK